jgi:hypothetical protein
MCPLPPPPPGSGSVFNIGGSCSINPTYLCLYRASPGEIHKQHNIRRTKSEKLIKYRTTYRYCEIVAGWQQVSFKITI